MEERSFDELIDVTCPSCRHAVPPDASVCPNCGYRLRAEGKRGPAVQAKAPSTPQAPKASAPKAKNTHVWGGIILMAIVVIVLVVTNL